MLSNPTETGDRRSSSSCGGSQGQHVSLFVSPDSYLLSSLLGITVSDGPNDMTCVRRIASNSTCSRMQDGIRVGDRIESINGESMLGKRHITVASLLRRIPIGQM